MRRFIKLAAALVCAGAATVSTASAYEANPSGQPFWFWGGGGSSSGYYPQATSFPREVVSFGGRYAPGSVIVSTSERRLYYVLGNGTAIRYAVGVGRPGFQWSGSMAITRKAEWPSWTPPAQMLKRRPDLPRYMSGGGDNPMGARAMYLGGSLYRIHGTNEPDTMGQAVSSGCIRMTNDDVIDLYSRTRIGTRVYVTR